jgi:hypothetical protein
MLSKYDRFNIIRSLIYELLQYGFKSLFYLLDRKDMKSLCNMDMIDIMNAFEVDIDKVNSRYISRCSLYRNEIIYHIQRLQGREEVRYVDGGLWLKCLFSTYSYETRKEARYISVLCLHILNAIEPKYLIIHLIYMLDIYLKPWSKKDYNYLDELNYICVMKYAILVYMIYTKPLHEL